jgi:hypothetical protein
VDISALLLQSYPGGGLAIREQRMHRRSTRSNSSGVARMVSDLGPLPNVPVSAAAAQLLEVT